MMDLEQELRAAMRSATDDLVAAPYVGARPVHHGRRHRLALAAAAASVATVVGLATWIAPTGSTLDLPVATTPGPTVATVFAGWGPTRGDLATSAHYLAQVRQEWQDPQGRSSVAGFLPLTHPQGEVRVLWAGSTPVGPAAVVAQDDAVEPGQTSVVLGVLRPAAQGPLLLATSTLGQEATYGQLDPDGIVFAPDPGGRYVVVVPANTGATVSARGRHEGAGRAEVLTNGSVLFDFGPEHVPGDVVVTVVQDGKTVVDTSVAASLAPEPSPPANLVGDWGVNGLFLGGAEVDGEGLDPAAGHLEDAAAWLRKLHLDPAQPVYEAPWGGPNVRTPDGGRVLARQFWTPGDPAHTIVLQQGPGATSHDFGALTVVSDDITDQGATPLVASRLDHAQGWLIGSGPDVELTAWRELGGTWHSLSKPVKVALLDTQAGAVQLRLSDGTTRTVTP
jgi:hypothetical protein